MANEWDWVQETGWEQSPSAPAGYVAPWEQDVSASQDPYAGSPVPDLGETGQYGVPLASAPEPQAEMNFPPDDFSQPLNDAASVGPVPTPEEMAQPPMPGGMPQNPGGLPAGIQSASMSSSGTGPYQEAPPVDLQSSATDAPSGEAMMSPMMAAHQASANAGASLYGANQGQASLDEDMGAERARIQLEEDTNRAIATAKRAQAEKHGNESVERARLQVKSINPSRRFSEASGFQKAVGMVAAGLAGYYAPYHGGKNAVIDQMMQLADQDIDAQKADQDAAVAGVSSAERMASAGVDSAQQMIRNVHFQRASRLEAVADHFAGEAAKVKSQFNAANLLKNNADIMNAAAEEYMKAKKLEADQTWTRQEHADRMSVEAAKLEQEAANRRQRAAEARNSLNLQRERLGAERDAASGKDKPPEPNTFANSPFNQRDVEVSPDVKISDANYTKVQEQYGDNADAIQATQNYLRLRKKLGRRYRGWGGNTAMLGDADKKALESAYGQVFYNVRKINTGAAGSGSEDKLISQIAGEPDGWTSASSEKATQQLEKHLVTQRQRFQRQYKIRYKDNGQVVDATDETRQADDVDIQGAKNPLAAARDSWRTVATASDPKAVLENLEALTDYANSDSSLSPVLHGIVAGSTRGPKGTVDTSKVKFTAASRLEARERIKAAAAKAAVAATERGDHALALELQTAADRTLEALKAPAPTRLRDPGGDVRGRAEQEQPDFSKLPWLKK